MLNRVTLALVLIALTAVALPVRPATAQDASTTPAEELREMKPSASDAAPAADRPEGDAMAPATEPAPIEGPANGQRGPFGDKYFLFIMIGGIILLYVWMGRSRRKREKNRKQMLASLSKGDKITSIGGIVGTVIEVREDEVTVKVDETNNVRMRFARWAVRGVGDEGRKEGQDA